MSLIGAGSRNARPETSSYEHQEFRTEYPQRKRLSMAMEHDVEQPVCGCAGWIAKMEDEEEVARDAKTHSY